MARRQALRSLANFFDSYSDTWKIPWKGKKDFIEVGVDANAGYRQRTIRNARESDITISVARDFEEGGEVLTRRSVAAARKPHVELKHLSETFDADVAATVARLNQAAEAKGAPIVINTAGNGLSALRANQDVADIYAMRLLEAVLKSPDRRFEIAQIRSGGQTGYDIAFIKAALANDIPVKIHAARGRETGGFLLRRRNGRDAELSLEEYLDELEVNGESIQKLVDKMRAGVQQAVAETVPLPRPLFTSAMSYKDGDYGLRMRPEFAGKSTMDLIVSGDRTGTSRQMRYLRNVSEGTVIEFKDAAGRTALVRVTSNPRQLAVPDDPAELQRLAETWSKLEGWGPENYQKLARQGYGQYTYEVLAIDGKPVRPLKPVTRIDLDELTPAQVEEQRRLLEVRGRDKPKDALESAIVEAQAQQMKLTETQRRKVDVERGEASGAMRDVESERRRAINRIKRGERLAPNMENVTLDDIARHVPELLDDRPTFDMDMQMDLDFIEGAMEGLNTFLQTFDHSTRSADAMPFALRFNLRGVSDILRDAFSKPRGKQDLELLLEYSGLGDVSHLGPVQLRAFAQKVWSSPDIDDAVKALFKPSEYFTSVQAADNFFPVSTVRMGPGARITAEGAEAAEEITQVMRVLDESKFSGASQAELDWLRAEGGTTSSLLLRVISGNFYGKREKADYMRIIGMRLSELNRRQKKQPSEATDMIEAYFKYLVDKAWKTESMYQILPARYTTKPLATRFQDPQSATPRIAMTLRGKQGEAIEVEFQWDSINSEIMPNGSIFVNGKRVEKNAIEVLNDLFEVDASYKSLIGDTSKLNQYHVFELGIRKPGGAVSESLLGRQFSSRAIKFDDGESLLDKFVLGTLGYRNDPLKRTSSQIILEAMADLKIEKKGGKEIRTWIPKKNPQLLHMTEGKPASAYARDYQNLVDQAFSPEIATLYETMGMDSTTRRNYENLVMLSQLIGRRQLSSSWDVNFWGKELTPAYALTRIMQRRRLRNPRPTRRFKANKVEEVEPEVRVFRSREDLPPEGPMTDDEIWYAYRVGEVREMPREQVESVIGIKRTTLDEVDFLDEQQIVRPFRDRIVERQVRGRQPRAEKPLDEDGFPITRTPSQKAGRILPRTDEEKALRRAKLTDEYGFEVLLFGDDVVDIMRKPGSNRNFGNPYHIDDAGNIVQRVYANTLFENYLLNLDTTMQWNPGFSKQVVYNHASYMRRNLWRLKGKKLSCVCGPRYCHGEVLLQYAESPDIARLIKQYGDDHAGLSDAVERALLAHGRNTRKDFRAYLGEYYAKFQDQLTTLPDDVTYRVQGDDLFIERINPRTDIGPGQG